MDKKLLLKKLEDLFYINELTNGFKSQKEAISWSNKVAPLLKFVDLQYFNNFVQNSHIINLPLNFYTIDPAFNIMKSQIEMAIEELKLKIEIEEGLPDQMYFPENSYLDIQKHIAKVVRQAGVSLWICDGYMDEKIVEELTEVTTSEIKFLTYQPKGLFKQRLSALKQQFPAKAIEARCANQYHDRYYVIDKDQVWSLGASYNKAGKKATLLSKIVVDNEKQKIIDDFERWWKSATILTV